MIEKSIYAFGNNILSTVVRTQTNLCAKIPIINVITKVLQNTHFVIQHIKRTNNIVNTTSIIAISKILYECAPFPGSPNTFLYLQKFIYIVYRLCSRFFTIISSICLTVLKFKMNNVTKKSYSIKNKIIIHVTLLILTLYGKTAGF